MISEAAGKPCNSSFQTQNLSIFHATQRTGPTDASLPSRLQKMSSPHASASLLVLQLYRYSIGFLPVWRTTFAFLRIPTRLVTQQQWLACIRRMQLACKLPPSSLDPRLVSGAFAVAKDEGCDRFIGDRRPLNSRERSTRRVHLPYCP